MSKRYEHIKGTNLYRILGRTHSQRRLAAIAWFEQGCVAEREHDRRQAEIFYQRALKHDSRYACAWINLGTIYFHQRRFRKSWRCYRRAVQCDSCSSLAWFNIGVVFEELCRPKEAAECYQKAIGIAPRYADAHYNLALLSKHRKETRKAIAHFRAYLQIEGARAPSSDYARSQIDALKAKDLQLVVSPRVSVVA